MRLKITRTLSGSIDGLQLSQFKPGELYDVGTSLGSYLLAVGAAESVIESEPAPGTPIAQTGSTEAKEWSNLARSIETAADHPSKKR